MATRALRNRQQAQVAPGECATTVAAPVKAAPARRTAVRKKIVEEAACGEDEDGEENDVVAEMPGKENAVSVAAAVSAAPSAAVPSTPARSKARPLDPCTPARTPLAAVPATPSTAQVRRTVPATPAAAAAASPPPPLPARPTAFVATDASLLRAMDVVFKKIDAVGTGFSATHGAPLDVGTLYSDLAAARSARDLGLVCHRLGLYLHRECKFVPAQQLHTMAAQYIRACKTLPHQTAEMEYFALTSMAKQAALAPPATAAPFAAFRDAAEKLLQVCEAGAAAAGADPTQQFSFTRTALWLHYELSHTHVQRALLLVHAHLPDQALGQVDAARADWGRFMERLGAALPPSAAPLSPAQLTQLGEVVSKIAEDLTVLVGAATFLSRADGGPWARLVPQLLQQEVRVCAALCGDNHLHRWRLAKLLQTPTASTGSASSSAAVAERSKWRKELLALPFSSSYAAASASTSPGSRSFCCASLSPMGVLLALYETAFVSPYLALSPREGDALQAALRSAVGRVKSDPRGNDGDVRHAYGLFYLAMAFIAAATAAPAPSPSSSPSSSSSAAAAAAASASASAAAPAIHSPLHASYRHSYQALKQFKSMLHRAECDSAAEVPGTALPRSWWAFLQDYTRCLYFRGVLAEQQGFHGQAQSLFENAMVTLEKVLYAQLQPSQQSGGGDALQQQQQQQQQAPFASILAGKLHRARVHSKLDRWDLALELLRCTGVHEAGTTEWTATATPFLGPYALHSTQVLHLQRGARSREGCDAAESLSDEMERMRLSEPSSPTSSATAAAAAAPCAQCALLPAPQSLPLLPCQVDALMASLGEPSSGGCSYSRAELEALVETHSPWRHPPLMRLLHHRLAALCHEADPAAAAFHLHQSLAISARHEVHELLGEAMHAEGEAASASNPSTCPTVAAAASCFALRPPAVESALFHGAFLSQLHQSWSVCTVDTDASGVLWISKVQPQHSDAPLSVSGQRLRALVESCLLVDLDSADIAAAVEAIHRARKHDAAAAASPAAALTWCIPAVASATSDAARADPAQGLSDISSAFAAALHHGNEASALAKDFNTRLKPALAGAAAGGKKPSAKEVKEAKAAVAGIDARRADADAGIAACCAQLQGLLGPSLGALVGRWAEADVEAGVVRAASALQAVLSGAKSTPQRLAAAVEEEVSSLRSRLKSPALFTDRPRLPVVLLLGGGAGHLPWENVPALRAQGFSRMASWHFMRASMVASAASASASSAAAAAAAASPSVAESALALLPPVSHSDSYFVLNPQENLKSAESSLLSLLSSERGWRGSVGAPDLGGWSAALRRRAYFAYVGHNGGEEFVPAKSIRQMLRPSPPSPPPSSSSSSSSASSASAAAAAGASTGAVAVAAAASSASAGVSSVALQIGCSSALQVVSKSGARPLYDPDGLSLAYQVALCPAMFGCLWNVTDDIDRWLTHVVQQLGQRDDEASTSAPASKSGKAGKSSKQPTAPSSSPMSLQQLSIAARDACKYNHLSGAAIICYGLPIAY